MSDEKVIAHLDFAVGCDAQTCDRPAVWAMTFHQCPSCTCEHWWALFCRTHGFQVIRQKRVRCHCSDTSIALHTWKAIDQ